MHNHEIPHFSQGVNTEHLTLLSQRDGLTDFSYDFWMWWEGLIGAKSRKEGHKHIELTVNVLWQIWKNRNLQVFNKEARSSMEVVTKAQQEWNEFELSNRKETGMTKEETEWEHQSTVNAVADGRGDTIAVAVQIKGKIRLQHNLSRSQTSSEIDLGSI